MSWLLATTAVAALGVGGQALAQQTGPSPAPAAASPVAATDTGSQLQEVTVYARKTAENLQKTPVTVTAVSGAVLKNAGIHTINDIQSEVPALIVQPALNGSFSPMIGLRGQAAIEVSTNFDPSVGIYYDGVYTGQSLGVLGTSYVDVNRVEVLEGPQGTLYGRNTTGGAYNIFSNLPTDRFEGSAMLGYGNFNRWEGAGVVNIPFGNDRGGLRLVTDIVSDDGYGKNTALNTPLNDEFSQLYRATLLLRPDPNTEIILRGDYQRSTDHGYIFDAGYLVPGGLTNSELAAELYGAINPTTLTNAYNKWVASANGNPFNVPESRQGHDSVSAGGVSLTVSHKFSDAFTLKSITAYRATDSLFGNDFAPLTAITYSTERSQPSQITEELQADGVVLDNRLNYVVGFYYFNQTSPDGETFSLAPALSPTSLTFANHNKDVSYAVYAQATYKLTSNLRLTGGLRYTTETKSDVSTATANGSCAVAIPPAAPNCLLVGNLSFSNVSYTAGLDWSPLDNLMLYVKSSSGFKAGGEQNRPGADPRGLIPFLPEYVTDYEGGAKSEFADHRIRLNGDVYYSSYTDIQRSVVISATGTAVENAASATIWGVEGQATVIPIDHLVLGGSLAYTNARYNKYIDGLGNNLTAQPFQDQPAWVYTLSGQYTVPTNFGAVTGRLDWYWRSSANLFPAGAGPVQFDTQPAYGLLSGKLSVHLNQPDLDIAFWIRNLLDQRYNDVVFDLTSSYGYTVSKPGEPRTFGVEFTKNF